jgi:hypothetical protein
MDEHAKTELHLSEEHLQQITGGCGLCDTDKANQKHFKDRAARLHWIATAAAAKGDRRQAKFLGTGSQFASLAASAFQESLDARLGTPGHPLAPGESSSSEPPAKRQRLS